MFNATEKEEKKHLSFVTGEIREEISGLTGAIDGYVKAIDDLQKYLDEIRNFADHSDVRNNEDGEPDFAEEGTLQASLDLAISSKERAVDRRRRMEELAKSPYFGRVDFVEKGEGSAKPVYIGICDFSNKAGRLVHDWRAPISSLFYDYEKGEAAFTAPAGEVRGRITLKRQYRIGDGKMEYMFDSSLKINDDILQEVLSRASSAKMKNIISSIQREQNAVIRDETHKIMLIQGVAGSGKTSIALHRVAYLLYRVKDELSADNVLIISPNKVFGSYISSVLPELGEENIIETEMEDLAATLLDDWRFQGFYAQVGALTDAKYDSHVEGIRFKATLDFARKLEKFLLDFEKNNLAPSDVSVKRGKARVSASRIQRSYDYMRGEPMDERLDSITSEVIDELEYQLDDELGPRQKLRVCRQIRGMFRNMNPIETYNAFLKSLGRDDLVPERGIGMEYADVFPVIFVKSFFNRIKCRHSVKHLIIDEMQDYTPVQYMVLKRLFNCNMTILGDSHQAVNPYSSTTMEEIREIFPRSFSIELFKSYRSTYEIMSFARRIIPDDKLVMMERHGDVPEIMKMKSAADSLATMRAILGDFRRNKAFASLGIICKNQKKANSLYKRLSSTETDVRLINAGSNYFSNGIVVVSAHMAKGLEFDQVVVPDVDAENYAREIDRYMLYVACTRAMHKLTLLHRGTPTEFLK
ncbi:MAG: AAA family ATPase [Victivallaceae bacterium]|nr:AAA family ATPase [Victivallaceae bacterium]